MTQPDDAARAAMEWIEEAVSLSACYGMASGPESDDLDKEVSALVEKVAAALRERDERITALLAFIGKPGDMSYEEVVKENARLAQARDRRTAVLEAYFKAHHEMFHPACNISGPPSPPSRLRQ